MAESRLPGTPSPGTRLPAAHGRLGAEGNQDRPPPQPPGPALGSEPRAARACCSIRRGADCLRCGLLGTSPQQAAPCQRGADGPRHGRLSWGRGCSYREDRLCPNSTGLLFWFCPCSPGKGRLPLAYPYPSPCWILIPKGVSLLCSIAHLAGVPDPARKCSPAGEAGTSSRGPLSILRPRRARRPTARCPEHAPERGRLCRWHRAGQVSMT